MRRREFITLLGGAAVALPLGASAQQAKSPIRIGMLPFGSPSNAYDQSLVEAFRSGLRQAGLIEGRDIALDIVWTTGGDADKAVAELIHRGVEMLVPTDSTASVATKRQTSTIPIVFISVGNPVAMGLVENLAHPGGNATGFSDIFSDLSAKLVQLGREVNKQETVDYLWHTAWPDGKNRFQATEQAAQSTGVKLRSRGIAESAEIDQAIMAMKQDGTVIVQPSPFTYRQRRHIIDTASHNGLATLFGFPVAARDGALIAYGPDYIHMNRRAPFYVDRILKGTKPADLPVELPTKIDLLVNLTTAKTLGVEVPLSLLIRADELIE
jgi:putative ABC transport system substrate-binding protein